MIRVVYDGQHHRLLMQGHAGYPCKGIDPICCAASVLCYTLAENVRRLDPKAQILLRPGYARIQCRNGNAAPVFACCYRGLSMLAEQYPAYIRCKLRNIQEEDL